MPENEVDKFHRAVGMWVLIIIAVTMCIFLS